MRWGRAALVQEPQPASTPARIWRRRAALMVGVGFLVALPLTLALDPGGDDGGTGKSGGAAEPAAALPGLEPGSRDRGLDVGYRVPKTWKEVKEASAIRLQSPDRSAEIVIAAPASASEADSVLVDALAAIRDGYEAVEVSPGSGREVGGLDAKGAVISAEADGSPLRIIVAVAKGGGRAYLVEVFTSAGVPAERLREAQVALNSLRLGA